MLKYAPSHFDFDLLARHLHYLLKFNEFAFLLTEICLLFFF